MKKFLKTLGVCIGFPILNLILVGFIQGFFLGYTNSNIELLNKNIFYLTIAGDVLTLILIIIMLIPSGFGLLKRINIKKIDFKEYIYILVFSVAVSIILLFLAGILSQLIPGYNNVSKTLSGARQSIVQTIIAVIFIPIYEEILFRGIIFGYLRKNFNIYLAIFGQSLIFGFMHLNLVQGIYTFILGIILALVYMESKSILGNITMHIVFNLFGMVIVPLFLSKHVFILMGLLIFSIAIMIFIAIKVLKKYEYSLYR